MDETGQEVPVGGVGELWVRGPQVMEGYWNNPVETANALKPEGWLATGDMARMDEDGFFYIVDRKKDMILSTSGFNVYPVRDRAGAYCSIRRCEKPPSLACCRGRGRIIKALSFPRANTSLRTTS